MWTPRGGVPHSCNPKAEGPRPKLRSLHLNSLMVVQEDACESEESEDPRVEGLDFLKDTISGPVAMVCTFGSRNCCLQE